MHRNTTPELAQTLDERLFLVSELFTTREQAHEYLVARYTALREQEKQTEDELRDFVRTNQDWSIYKEGSEAGIDTALPTTNGEAYHLWVSSEHGNEILDNESSVSPSQSAEILSEASQFRVLYYSKNAMQYITRQARRGESLLAKVRQRYTPNPSIITLSKGSAARSRTIDQRMAEFYQSGDHSVTIIPFEAPEPSLMAIGDAQTVLEQATYNRAKALAEHETHHEEYKTLLDQLKESDGWENDTRQRVEKRLMAIQVINGYLDPHLNWQAVLPKGLDRLETLENDPTWDVATIRGLKDAIISTTEIDILKETIRTQSIAAQALKIITAQPGA